MIGVSEELVEKALPALVAHNLNPIHVLDNHTDEKEYDT